MLTVSRTCGTSRILSSGHQNGCWMKFSVTVLRIFPKGNSLCLEGIQYLIIDSCLCLLPNNWNSWYSTFHFVVSIQKVVYHLADLVLDNKYDQNIFIHRKIKMSQQVCRSIEYLLSLLIHCVFVVMASIINISYYHPCPCSVWQTISEADNERSSCQSRTFQEYLACESKSA